MCSENSVAMWFRGLVTRCIGVRVEGLGFVFWLADLGRKVKGLIRTSKSHKGPRHPGSKPGNGFANCLLSAKLTRNPQKPHIESAVVFIKRLSMRVAC